MAGGLLAGCGSSGPSGARDPSPFELSTKRYVPADRAVVDTLAFDGLLPGQTTRLVLARPARGEALPVVVYLPGLGEASEAGERWRQAWAAAGYAVLSVQLLEDDAAAWRSELARDGEFKLLGRQHFAGAMVGRRVRLLQDLLTEGRRRTSAGEAGWQRLDWNRLAVAGFDLGAYTAMTVAGEHVRDAEDASGRVALRAAIVLSPHASAAAGASDSRYRDIRPPVLSVTSDVDRDLLGLVESAALRSTPYAHMDGPDKYLLMLRGVPHGALGGNPAREADARSASRRSPEAASKSPGDDAGQRRRGKRGSANDGDPPGRSRSAAGNEPDPAALSPAALQARLIAAQDVCTAFLDAYLKDDPRARAWLAADAPDSLGAIGELRHK